MLSPASLSKANPSWLLPLWKPLQDQQMCLIGSFQITVFVQELGACENLCPPFKSRVSISLQSSGTSYACPAGFQWQMFWGFMFSRQDSWAEELNVGLGPLVPYRELCRCDYLPIYVWYLSTQGMCVLTHWYIPLPVSWWFLLICLAVEMLFC